MVLDLKALPRTNPSFYLVFKSSIGVVSYLESIEMSQSSERDLLVKKVLLNPCVLFAGLNELSALDLEFILIEA